MNINAKIAELILRAQNASDGGKGIREFTDCKRAIRDNLAGYGSKDTLIISAINMIARNTKVCNYKFAVTASLDQNGYRCFIVYFQTVINGEKVQVSFHSFNNDLRRYCNKSFRIKWDHNISRDSAVFAYRYYCGNGIYGGGYIL